AGGGPLESVLWSGATGAIIIPELQGQMLINDNGVIVGTRTGTNTFMTPGTIALWSGGVVTDIVQAFPVSNGGTTVPHWVFRAFENDGRILADVSTQPYR